MSLILYRRAACELCELAERELVLAGVNDWTAVDVGWDGALAERYGGTLPVLRDDARERELAWPFDAWRLREWLAA